MSGNDVGIVCTCGSIEICVRKQKRSRNESGGDGGSMYECTHEQGECDSVFECWPEKDKG